MVQTFGKTRGVHRWAQVDENTIAWGVGKQIFAWTPYTERGEAVKKVEAWIAGAVWEG